MGSQSPWVLNEHRAVRRSLRCKVTCLILQTHCCTSTLSISPSPLSDPCSCLKNIAALEAPSRCLLLCTSRMRLADMPVCTDRGKRAGNCYASSKTRCQYEVQNLLTFCTTLVLYHCTVLCGRSPELLYESWADFSLLCTVLVCAIPAHHWCLLGSSRLRSSIRMTSQTQALPGPVSIFYGRPCARVIVRRVVQYALCLQATTPLLVDIRQREGAGRAVWTGLGNLSRTIRSLHF